MTVYVDVLFAINTLMDYITLLAAARLGGLHSRRFRLLIAACVGGAYAVLAAAVPFLSGLIGWGLCGLVICAAAFYGHPAFVRLCTLYFMVAASFAGISSVLGAATSRVLIINGVYYFSLPIRLLVLCAVIGYTISGVLLRGDATHGAIRQEIEQMKISFLSHTIQVRVLRDTGNDLIEPVSRRSVLVIGQKSAQILLGDDKLLLDRLKVGGAAACLAEMPERMVCYFGLLPYRAVGTSNGMLLYFRPDGVWRADGEKVDCVIAISPEIDGCSGYEGLIGIERE